MGHEVLVKVRSVALNYRDIAICNLTYPVPVKDSVIPSSDLAGDVVQAASVDEDAAAGDKVITAFEFSTADSMLERLVHGVEKPKTWSRCWWSQHGQLEG
ncbi:hypothetical protein QQZ08_001869 [Neonectria magnoliae]|uniref:Alcohol dehydrogenase-like N-terminal domain-containing protein n=1 Tax=Neonectria magnoliae TaxID=2732573 RepID=A0ABR1IEK0_9HYPO